MPKKSTVSILITICFSVTMHSLAMASENLNYCIQAGQKGDFSLALGRSNALFDQLIKSSATIHMDSEVARSTVLSHCLIYSYISEGCLSGRIDQDTGVNLFRYFASISKGERESARMILMEFPKDNTASVLIEYLKSIDEKTKKEDIDGLITNLNHTISSNKEFYLAYISRSIFSSGKKARRDIAERDLKYVIDRSPNSREKDFATLFLMYSYLNFKQYDLALKQAKLIQEVGITDTEEVVTFCSDYLSKGFWSGLADSPLVIPRMFIGAYYCFLKKEFDLDYIFSYASPDGPALFVLGNRGGAIVLALGLIALSEYLKEKKKKAKTDIDYGQTKQPDEGVDQEQKTSSVTTEDSKKTSVPSEFRDEGVDQEQKTSSVTTEDSKKTFIPSEFRVVDSFSEIDHLSHTYPIMLFADKAERGSGETHALKKFKKKVLPVVDSKLTSAGIAICWSNVGGVFRMSKLAEYLKKEKIRACGCFLFKDGSIVSHKKIGSLVGLEKDYIDAALSLASDYIQEPKK